MDVAREAGHRAAKPGGRGRGCAVGCEPGGRGQGVRLAGQGVGPAGAGVWEPAGDPADASRISARARIRLPRAARSGLRAAPRGPTR